MLKNKYLKEWSCIVSERMPHLSMSQAIGLATWSFGMVMTSSSSLTQVSRFMAGVNGEKPNTVAPGQSSSVRVVCFKTNPIECTLLARWDFGYKDPWLILTDLEPKQADALWYGLRPSTECVYRDIKSDGWQWHNTRLLDPQRAERLWLAIAVSTLWMVILGGDAENLSPLPNWEQLPPKHIAFSKPLNLRPPRLISCFLLGLLTLIADLLNGISIHLHRWSSFPPTPVDGFYYSYFSSS